MYIIILYALGMLFFYILAHADLGLEWMIIIVYALPVIYLYQKIKGIFKWFGNNKPNIHYIPTEVRREVYERAKGNCEFPGCGEKNYLKIHHLKHAAQGGPSIATNLILVCPYHHDMMHDGGPRTVNYKQGGTNGQGNI